MAGAVRIVCQCDECPNFRRPIDTRVHRETETSWVFECPVCLNIRAIGKAKFGGTPGSGLKENGCRGMFSVKEDVCRT